MSLPLLPQHAGMERNRTKHSVYEYSLIIGSQFNIMVYIHSVAAVGIHGSLIFYPGLSKLAQSGQFFFAWAPGHAGLFRLTTCRML